MSEPGRFGPPGPEDVDPGRFGRFVIGVDPSVPENMIGARRASDGRLTLWPLATHRVRRTDWLAEGARTATRVVELLHEPGGGRSSLVIAQALAPAEGRTPLPELPPTVRCEHCAGAVISSTGKTLAAGDQSGARAHWAAVSRQHPTAEQVGDRSLFDMITEHVARLRLRQVKAAEVAGYGPPNTVAHTAGRPAGRTPRPTRRNDQ